MSDQRTPLDKGAVSDDQRAQWAADIRAGREPWVDPIPSRRRFGRFLDVLERIVGASVNRPYR